MTREIKFKMERPGLLSEGDQVHISEGVLPTSVYYTIDPALAMSGNISLREKLISRDGVVSRIEKNERGYYVYALFEEEDK